MGAGDFDLTMDELRAVVRLAADCAQELLHEFEAVAPDDTRPCGALVCRWCCTVEPATNGRFRFAPSSQGRLRGDCPARGTCLR